MTDTPGMMLWTDAYLADTGHLTTFEHGAYLLLLMAMWRAGGRLPNDEVRLARTVGVSIDKWRRYVAPTIMPLLTVEGAFVTQKRLAREAGKARARVASARAAGIASSRAKALKDKEPAENPSPSRSNGKATLQDLYLDQQDRIDSDESIVGEAADVGDSKNLTKGRKRNPDLLQTVVGMWNDLASAMRLVAVRDITPTRQSAIIARSEDLVKTYDFPDPLEGWRKLMGLVRGSPFLRGELNGFRCDFDFVTRASSFTKIMEGKYEARQAAKRR